jgi:hypothetical protein
MIASMPKPRPPSLHRQVSQHGRVCWYVRIGKGPRVRLRAEFGSPDFHAEYQAALLAKPRHAKGAPATGTLAWLIARYRESAAWQSLSLATRRQRENIFVQVLKTAGDKPFDDITPATINQALERRAKTPAQARHFLDAVRGVFRWGVKANHIRTDPTASVDNPERRTGDGFPPWSEEHVEAYTGPSALAKESGWMCCFTPVYGVAMPCG